MNEVCMSPKIRVVESDFDGFSISNLPDELICNILCFLPIEEAVRTSVLSRDWEHKWTSLYDLNIDENYFSTKPDVQIFVSVVYKILFATRNNLRSFRLSCDNRIHSNHIVTWISEVLRRRVENLVIVATTRVCNLDISSRCFERCTSLTQLKLAVRGSNLTMPTERCLLNLKSLSLGCELGLTQILVNKSAYLGEGHVLLKFPVLEFLELRSCKWLKVETIEIHAPNLITFKADCKLQRQFNNYSIKIYGPKLATFESTYYVMDDYILDAPAVTSATLACHAQRALKVLEGFPELICLNISGGIVRVLAQAKSGRVTPTFFGLKRLELSSKCSTDDLLEFLKAVPFLESLSLNMRSWKGYDYENRGGANLPTCITSCLKEVKFLKFWEEDAHVELAKFILKSAENLRSVLVLVERVSSGPKQVEKRLLSELIPKSPTCVLKVELDQTLIKRFQPKTARPQK